MNRIYGKRRADMHVLAESIVARKGLDEVRQWHGCTYIIGGSLMKSDTEKPATKRLGPASLLILVLAVLPCQGALVDESEESKKTLLDQPAEFHTGTRSGRVIDAVTGEPIEGAVVVFKWDVAIWFIEPGTMEGTTYEATTDKNGRYFIPDQTVKRNTEAFAGLKAEEVLIYKVGYIWYKVYEDRVEPFMTVLPNLKQRYRQQDNLVKLEPWIEELSHLEHIAWLSGPLFAPGPGPLLKGALAEENALAEPERRLLESAKSEIEEATRELGEYRNAFAKGELAKEDYTEILKEYVSSPHMEIVREAGWELKNIDDRATIPYLIKHLRKNIYRADFDTVLSLLESHTGRKDLKDTVVIPERQKLAAEIDQWWQRVKDRSRPEWFGDLLLNGSNTQVKSEAVFAIWTASDDTVLPYLKEFLEREDEDVVLQESILGVVSKMRAKSLIPQVKKKLLSPDVYVRRQAALALAKLGDSCSVSVMIESLKSKRRNSRSVANATLKELTGLDFSQGKSLRVLSPQDEAGVVERWMKWWQENKAKMREIDMGDFSTILDKEEDAIAKRYAAMAAAEAENPDAPVIDDPQKSPKAVFAAYKQAALAGDVDKALSYFAPICRIEHEERLRRLLSLPGYGKGLGDIYFDKRLVGTYEYNMPFEADNAFLASRFVFVTDGNGNWIISQM